MRKFISILFLFICKISFAQTFIVSGGDTINRTDNSGIRQGYWIIYGKMQNNKAYGVNSKVEEGNYLSGKKTGVWICYHPNGNKKSEYTYVDNRPKGHAITYSENGHVQEEGMWAGTHWVGSHKLYYNNDSLRQALYFNEKGQRDSAQYYYYPNGNFYETVTYSNGKEIGWKKEYDENGNLIRETYYNEGVVDPSKTKSHSSTNYPKKNKIEKTVPIKHDPTLVPRKIHQIVLDPNGKFTLYDGDTVNRTDAKDKRQGHWIIYGSLVPSPACYSDQKVEEGNYLDNEKTGTWVTYYTNEKKQREIEYVSNLDQGHVIFYDETGAKYQEGTYINGRWSGLCVCYYSQLGIVHDSLFYSPSGEVIRHVQYDSTGYQIPISAGHDHAIPIMMYDKNGNRIFYPLDVSRINPTAQIFNGEGKWKLYNKNHQVEFEGTFHLGRLMDGKRYIYTPTGLISKVLEFKGGKRLYHETTDSMHGI